VCELCAKKGHGKASCPDKCPQHGDIHTWAHCPDNPINKPTPPPTPDTGEEVTPPKPDTGEEVAPPKEPQVEEHRQEGPRKTVMKNLYFFFEM
ncbi:MAG: hypothetical protein RR198_05415, partial [Oscillospiraceae bacterium]